MITETRRDGGYGWVIVLAFFLVMLLVDGLRYTFGLYFVEFLDEFKEGRGDTAWIGSIMVGVFNITGPFMAFVIHKLGFRLSSILGSILSCVGFILSVFATNIHQLYLTYGILQGYGLGLLFLSGTVAVGQYFLNKRALAIGLAYTGSGVGTIVLVPFTRYLMDMYGWRGSLLILGGLALQCCVLCSLYRPFESNIVKQVYNKSLLTDGDHYSCVSTSLATCNAISNDNEPDECRNGARLMNKPSDRANMRTIDSGPTGLQHPRSFAQMRKDQLTLEIDIMQGQFNTGSKGSLVLSSIGKGIAASTSSLEYTAAIRSSIGSNLHKPVDKKRRLSLDSSKEIYEFNNSVVEQMFPKRLLTSANFLLLMMSCWFSGVASFIPYSMLPDFALSMGCSESESGWLISVLGIGGTIGRVLAGCIADMPCVHTLSALGIALLACGVLTMFAAMMTSFWPLVVYSTLHALFFGSTYIFIPIVAIELLSDKYIGQIMGGAMFMFGTSMLIGSPIAGWIFDATGNYRISFLFSGASFLAAGVVNFFVLCTKESRQARKRRRAEI